MYCPRCNAEIKDHDQKQCPKCNSLLLENPDKEILTSVLQADKQSQHTQTDARGGRSESRESDDFDLFLEDITTEIDRLVASDKEDAAESTGQVPKDDETSAQAPHRKIELTAEIKQYQETSDMDEPIDDLGPLIQAFDELIGNDLDSEIEASREDPPPTAEPDAVIELTDVFEPANPREDKLPTEGSDKIIDLFDTVEPVIEPEDECIETIPDIEIQPVDEIDPADFQDDELMEEITAQDFVSDDVPGLQVPDDGEAIEEITEQDFVFIQPVAAKVEKEADVELPAKPKRSSTAIFVAAGMIVLLIAAVLGAKLYFMSKQASFVTPPKSSAVIVKKKAKQAVVQKTPAEEQTSHSAGKNSEKRQGGTAITTPVASNTKAVAALNVDVDRAPPATMKGIEQQTIDTLKSAPVPMTESKTPKTQEEITQKFGAEKNVIKNDASAAYIRPGEPYFTIQVATLKSRSVAESSLAGLQNKGYDAFVSEKITTKGLVRYKLRIGKYKTKEKAKKAAESYFDQEHKPFIIVQSKEAI